jgi:hypothetical protein
MQKVSLNQGTTRREEKKQGRKWEMEECGSYRSEKQQK